MEEKRSAPTKRKASDDLSEQTATTAPESSSGSRDVDNDRKVEEQMERFYALLENIKSMRYAWGGGRGGMSQKKMKVDEKKREPEVPWKPTFRLEDFMQGQDDKSGERRVKKEDGGERSDVES